MTNHLDEMSHVPQKKPLLNYALITLLFWNQQLAQLDQLASYNHHILHILFDG